MVLRSEYIQRSLAPPDNSLGSLVFCRSQLCSPGAFCAFICIVALWIKASVFMAIFFFYALIDPFQRGWNRLYFFKIFGSNSITAAYSEVANQCCIVIEHREGIITAQLFVLLYLADNLSEGDTNVYKITVSLHKYMYHKTLKNLSYVCREKTFCTHGLGFCV